jgi:hypothetical protein
MEPLNLAQFMLGRYRFIRSILMVTQLILAQLMLER